MGIITYTVFIITFVNLRGNTDCALPMIWASQQRKPFDVFIVLTDSETYYGNVHPAEALRNYRSKMNIPDAKLIVFAMEANKFTIADPLIMVCLMSSDSMQLYPKLLGVL